MIFRTRRVQPRPPVQQGFLKIKLFQSRSYPRSRNGTSDNSGFFAFRLFLWTRHVRHPFHPAAIMLSVRPEWLRNRTPQGGAEQ